jgi:hypothetical protein
VLPLPEPGQALELIQATGIPPVLDPKVSKVPKVGRRLAADRRFKPKFKDIIHI